MQIVFVFIFVVAGAFTAYFNSPKRKGKRGEKHVGEELEGLSSEYVVLNDVVLRTNRGTTQIDHIVVSPYGIFGIETKNYRGEIYGDDSRSEWTQVIATDVTYRKKLWKTYTYVTKNHFYNPVKQSLGHVLALKENLDGIGYVPFVPMVVFAGNAELANVHSQYPVVHKEGLLPAIYGYEKIYLTKEQVREIVRRIRGIDVRESVKDREHVMNVKRAAIVRDEKIAAGVCPRCGGKLVLRKGEFGSFYGCSNYPKCRFTSKISS